MNAFVAVPPAHRTNLAAHCPTTVLSGEMERLYAALSDVSAAENPRTARLMNASLRKISQKLVEEATEVALEAVRKRTVTTVSESADLLYHLVVLWQALDIAPEDVWLEMRHRANALGIAEKRPKRVRTRTGG